MTDSPERAADPPSAAHGEADKGNASSQGPQEGETEESGISRRPEQSKSSSTSIRSSRETTPPPLPPRQKDASVFQQGSISHLNTTAPTASPGRPQLQSKPTTALSLADINVSSSRIPSTEMSDVTASGRASILGGGYNLSRSASDIDESMSARSGIPPTDAGVDLESILGEVISERNDMDWKPPFDPVAQTELVETSLFVDDDDFERSFAHEFDELEDMKEDGSNESAVVAEWKSKLKHFLILSSAGKPIWSRHGDDRLITNYVGIVQTIISFYQGSKDGLKGFTAGNARFVVLIRGPLSLIAVSRLGESDSQLRVQLESLYMQILSTLTLPSMEKMFTNRPSTDLRRPLQGTETLLSALADGFTRGSPSTLLSALECLKMRKTHRQIINNTLLKARTPNLLYGLVVAGGRLVSVVRPKKHSLHPGDLHLIFNMLFEAGSVKAGGGENWIPLCLPGFNNTGFLYMYVSFISLNDLAGQNAESRLEAQESGDEITILLISTDRESFFELKEMRDRLVLQMEKNRSMAIIRNAVKQGRSSCADLVPGSMLRHFLYKSRGNVQFFMPSYEPVFGSLLERRRLLSLYGGLHSTLHTRPTAPKIHHEVTNTHTAIAWTTPLFELYALAPSGTSRVAMAAAANAVINYVKRNEERIFIIGGAVF